MIGNDLVLTIGLPLAATMSVRELTAVLAHEFGHFSQGVGMRFSYLTVVINRWFARVVYERDAWDERLTEWSRESDVRIAIILVRMSGSCASLKAIIFFISAVYIAVIFVFWSSVSVTALSIAASVFSIFNESSSEKSLSYTSFLTFFLRR